jgi:hypothetical protein
LVAEAQRQLQMFKDSNDAYERRGYANGLTKILDILKTLHDGPVESQSPPIGEDEEKPNYRKGQVNDNAGETRGLEIWRY